MKKIFRILTIVFLLTLCAGIVAYAEPGATISPSGITITTGSDTTNAQYVDNIKLLILLTFLSFLPAVILLMTSFTRIIIVLGFVRNALSTAQSPPNQVLVGLAIFMTIFIMSPVYSKINSNAIQPYINGELTQEEAVEIGSRPLKEFMLKQTYEKDLALFLKAANIDKPHDKNQVSFTVLIPAFAMSELKTAFQMGFLIFLPFIVIDIVVACILMSMGMFMLSPVTISLPFKILLFVMADGWHLVIKSLLDSFM